MIRLPYNLQLKNLFCSNSSQNTVITNKSTVHGCPFCKCRSLDPSLRQISQRPNTSHTLFLGKTFLDQKLKNKSLQGNIYYRAFQSPKRRGLSPNMNKKIIIKYNNRPFNEQSFGSKNKILSELENSLKKSVFYNDNQKQIKKTNIYVNQNTPPKPTFLTKRSSSRQKNAEVFKKRVSKQSQKYYQPENQLKLVNVQSQQSVKIQSVKKQQDNVNQISKIRVLERQQPDQSQSDFNKHIRYYRFGDNNRLQVSPIKQNIVNNKNYVQTKYAVEKLSSPRESSSPYGSAQENSTQIFPFIFQKSLEKAQQQNNSRQNITPSKNIMLQQKPLFIGQSHYKTEQKQNSDKKKTIQKNKSKQIIQYNYSQSDNNGTTSQKKINFHVYNKDSLKNIQGNNLNRENDQQAEHAGSQIKLSEYELASQISEDLKLNYDYYEPNQNSDLSISQNITL